MLTNYTPSLVSINGKVAKQIDFRTLSGDRDALHHVMVQLPQDRLKPGENLLKMSMGS
ncbi:hypothetical protein [Candidatus Entotheonella palauensis]|uniref:hypothetical protein n=1 Tax=Candidatus Entotheonella palauensis TaxID=93172 RepID=UPI0015C4A1FE|nr:hypothetical protein [Candidatus Entotheonella palauensis]